MESKKLDELMRRIGYKFTNPSLLVQACTRRSYAEEHPESLDNEQLEFYGDKIIEFVIMKAMCARYGYVREGGMYFSQLREGELTQIKTEIVCGSSFAKCADYLELEDFLILGNGDVAQNVKSNESVQEALLEAIVGAVALDCNWTLETLEHVVQHLLELDCRLAGASINKKIDRSIVIQAIGEPTLQRAVNQLQELAQKNITEPPTYDFASTVEDKGDVTWSCVCRVPGIGESLSENAHNKASAKKLAAFEQLKCVLQALDQEE